MNKVEFIIGILALLGVSLHILNIPGGSILTVLSALTLSFLYLPLGIFLFNNVKLSRIGKKESYNGLNAFKQVSFVLVGMGLQILVLGILFKIMNWSGADIMNWSGIIIIIFTLIISVIAFINGPRQFFLKIVKRVIVYGGLAILLAFMPKYLLLDIKYREYPEYRDALKASLNDPDNIELKQKSWDEHEKMMESIRKQEDNR